MQEEKEKMHSEMLFLYTQLVNAKKEAKEEIVHDVREGKQGEKKEMTQGEKEKMQAEILFLYKQLADNRKEAKEVPEKMRKDIAFLY